VNRSTESPLDPARLVTWLFRLSLAARDRGCCDGYVAPLQAEGPGDYLGDYSPGFATTRLDRRGRSSALLLAPSRPSLRPDKAEVSGSSPHEAYTSELRSYLRRCLDPGMSTFPGRGAGGTHDSSVRRSWTTSAEVGRAPPSHASAGLVYVSCFPDCAAFTKYAATVA
jgi:hypothetical protein